MGHRAWGRAMERVCEERGAKERREEEGWVRTGKVEGSGNDYI